jgi:hypothetical protein
MCPCHEYQTLPPEKHYPTHNDVLCALCKQREQERASGLGIELCKLKEEVEVVKQQLMQEHAQNVSYTCSSLTKMTKFLQIYKCM